MNPAITAPQEQDLARRALRGQGALDGASYTPTQSAKVNAVINQSAAGTYVLIPGVTGQQILVHEVLLYSAASQTLELFDGATSLLGPLTNWPAQSGIYLPDVGEPHFELLQGNALKLTLSGAGQVSGFVRYRMG